MATGEQSYFSDSQEMEGIPSDFSDFSPSEDSSFHPSTDTESAAQEFGPSERPIKRKYAEPDLWKRNQRKRKRNSGKEYVNTLGHIIPAKRCKEFGCECMFQCSKKITWDQRRQNFESFYSNSSWETQTAILISSIRVAKVSRRRDNNSNHFTRNYSRHYYLRAGSVDVEVCKEMFMNTLVVSSARIHRALKKSFSNCISDMRGKHRPGVAISDANMAKVHEHIQSFPSYESHYRRSDTPNSRYLSEDLNLSKMFALYEEWIKNDEESTSDLKSVSFATYKRVFYKHFQLKFKKPKKDTCKVCDSLKIQIDALSAANDNSEDIVELKKKKEEHLEQVDLMTTSRAMDLELAKDTEMHLICFDLQKTFPLPKVSTSEAYYKRQLSIFNFGIHNLATKQGHMYLWHEGIASRGAQEVGSCLIEYIRNSVKSKKLVCWSDACGGQNRNVKIALIWMHIADLDDNPIEVIEHKFCVSGHSYLANDRDFSQIENKTKKVSNMFSFDEFNQIVASCKQNKKKFQVVKMESNMFFSTKPLEGLVTNRKKDKSKEKVNWLSMKVIRVEKSKPGILMYKYSHDPDTPYIELDLRKRLGGPSPNFKDAVLTPLYPNGHGVSKAKYTDIIHLLRYVPPIHHKFYENLKQDDDKNDDVELT